MTVDAKVREAEMEVSRDEAFSKWLSAPMTRMGMAAIPAGDHQDALKLLLRSAFDTGSGHGVGEVLKDMLTAIVKSPRDDRDPFRR